MKTGLYLLASALLANAAPAQHADAAAKPALLNCDASITANFKPDAQTKVLLVKSYRKGDRFPDPPEESRFDPSAPPTIARPICAW